MKRFFAVFAVLLVGSAAALGQYTNILENGSSQTITNVWDASDTDILVGGETSGNSMDVINGGSVTNWDTFLGDAEAAGNNDVSITGTNASWVSIGNMYVGYDGSTNKLMITDGGRMENDIGFIGYSSTADNNSVLVSGEGSVWSNSSDLVVGREGSGNNLTIEDGGVVSNYNGYAGGLAGASNNTVSVSGDGARWVNGGNLVLGNEGASNNSITVESDGTISAAELWIATNNNFNLNDGGNLEITRSFDAGQTGFNWNDGGQLSIAGSLTGISELDGQAKTLVITDDGIWKTGTNDLSVGATGADNTMVVTNGGFAGTSGSLLVGSTNAASGGNAVTIGDGGTIEAGNLMVYTNNSNSLNLNDGGTLAMIGDFNMTDPLAQFNWNGGGTLSVGGDLSGIDGLYETNQLLVIDGGTWTTNSDLTIGLDGSGNKLTIRNGGVVSNINAVVGSSATAISNKVVVTDGAWINAGDLTIGGNGSYNELLIRSDGVVSNANAHVGATDGAIGNSVEVVGEDAMWVNDGVLQIGSANNSNNVVSVGDGGTVVADGLDISSANNAFRLNDAGTLKLTGNATILQSELAWADGGHLWTQADLNGFGSIFGNRKTLTIDDGSYSAATATVGYDGTGNLVSIINGGTATVDALHIGVEDNNSVEVGGTNSTLNIASDLYVGQEGSDNKLTVTAHGQVVNDEAFVGWGKEADGNSVDVSGENAAWTSTDLHVGRIISDTVDGVDRYYTNANNSVSVSDGGTVQADTLVIQDGNSFELKDGGTLRMTDEFNLLAPEHLGLDWQNGGNLSVGGAFSGLTNFNLNAGRILTLDGSGAVWDEAEDTNMVVSGGGELQVANAAIVKAGNLDVLDDNSLVNVESNAWLLVGDGAETNDLVNGGVMVAATNGALLSVEDFASVNIAETLMIGTNATVTGTVSVSNDGTITAGELVIADTNSAFNLENGGTLAMTDAFDASIAGFNWQDGGHLSVGGALTGMSGTFDGTNKVLTLDGGNWDEGSGDLMVGEFGASNTLNVVNGGAVTNANGFVGFSSNAWGNAVAVSGSNSVWNNTGTLQIGTNWNSGNSVTVSDNGTVIAGGLTISTNNYFNLKDGGTLRMTGDNFDVSDYINTLNWESGGNLYVEGDLTLAVTNLVVEGSTNAYAYIDGGHIVTVGGTLLNDGDTNLIVGLNSSNNELIITNGTVDNANGYIGWGAGAKDNLVRVSGADSTWTNRNNLYVGGYAGSNSWNNAGAGNSLVVEDGAWVFVGDAATNLSSNPGGIAVAGTDGAEMVVGNGDVSVDTLYVGAGSSFTGTVDVLKDGTVTLTDLVLADGLGEFNLEGTLTVVSNSFDAGQDEFNWMDNGRLVMRESDLYGISSITGAHQKVTIDGGSWSNSTGLAINGSNNELWIKSTSNNFSVVTSTEGSIGTATNDFNNSVTLSGSNSVWQNKGDLYVGNAGSGNSLTVEGGATNNNVNGYIGYASGASNNLVLVTGSNSAWNNTGDLHVGYEGSNSTLTVADNGHVSVGTNLFVQNDGALILESTGSVFVAGNMTVSNASVAGAGTVELGGEASQLSIYGSIGQISTNVLFDGGGGADTEVAITDGELVVAGTLTNRFVNFETLGLTNSLLGGSGTVGGFTNVTVSGGWIAPNGDLVIEGDFKATNATLQVTAGADSLQVTNTNGLDLAGMAAEVIITDNVIPNAYDQVILTADGGLSDTVFASTNFTEHFLLYDFNLLYGSNSVSVVSEAALDGEIGSALTYAGIQGVRGGFNGMQNAVFVRTKQLRRNAVATDNAISQRASEFKANQTPEGPQGFGDDNTIFGMHFWAEQYSGQGDYDAMGNSDAFTLNNNGTTFGFDKLIGDSTVAGINYTYARSDALATGGDRVDTETYWLGLYGEWVTKNEYYLEGLAGLGWSDYETIRADIGYTGVGKFSGNDVGGHIEGGKYLHYNNWAMAPYAGLHYLWIKSDAYTETEEQSGNEIEVGEQKVASLESALGVKLRNRFDTKAGRFQTTGYAEWAYDFINDDIESTLDGDGNAVKTARITPGASLINAGIGLSWICTEYLEVGVGYDARLNDNYEEHQGSIMFDVRF